MNGEEIGRCIGEASTDTVSFVSKKMPRIGEYVMLEYEGRVGPVLGMIETLVRGNVGIPEEIYDPEMVERIRRLEGEEYYIQGRVRIIGQVESLRIPRTPPPPGTRVLSAPPEVLKRIFGERERGIRIGTLITQEDVAVHVDTNRMVTRHLAILAMTGAGKSNTVAVIVDRLLEKRGTVLIFDMHSEYISTKFRNGEVHPLWPALNPRHLAFKEISRLAYMKEERANVQARYFRNAYETTIREIEENQTGVTRLFERMKELLMEYAEDEQFRNDRNSIFAALNKLEDFEERYEQLMDLAAPEVVESIVPGRVNVIDLGSVDEDAADVIVSHTLRKLLTSRKQYIRKGEGLGVPIFAVLEEAHILAPRTRSTDSKYWISRIAREGRKFGVGLCLVSQSPKSLDPDSLSQMNNMIISRLVEPEDQRHVRSASESLSEDLMSQLPSLNIGEAIVIGLMTRVPALVKVDEFTGKLVGGEIDVVAEWRRAAERMQGERERRRGELGSMEDY